MKIRELIIKDVRCFAGEQKFTIRPITFLVGENSTGKSTVLGCLQILSNFMRGRSLNFNVEPFIMGTFVDIVRRSTPRNESFQIGIEVESNKKEKTKYSLTLSKKDRGFEPVVQRYQAVFGNGDEIVVEKKEAENQFRQLHDRDIEPHLSKKGGKFVVLERTDFIEETSVMNMFLDIGIRLRSAKYKKHNTLNINNEIQEVCRIIDGLNVQSFAPIRSEPERTYDPLKAEKTPKGDETPMTLNTMSRTNKEAWDKLQEKLIEFGKSSGLFSNIDVLRLGKSESGPFQIQIKVRGPKVNLIDAGYGVSQILPILACVLNEKEPTHFLIQQPEVHLHPKAQAELSSLLVEIHQTMGHSFVIETHSDYMVDRARIEIGRGNIKPEDVSLIYLEPVGNRVEAHSVSFDENSNIKGVVPKGYQDFYIKETNSILSCGGD